MTAKHIIADCLKCSTDWIDHKIAHNLDIALGPNYNSNQDIINFLIQTTLYNYIK